MTDTTREQNESIPFVTKISLAMAREPLPETGRRRENVSSSSGMPRRDVSGERAAQRISSAPDARKTLIAANRPMSGGKMETTVFSPSFAPVTNDEKTSVPRKKFKFGILRSIE